MERSVEADYFAYLNHIYRVIHFCLALCKLDVEEKHRVTIAACFHDLGIWSNKTFDYLALSVSLACDWFNDQDLEHDSLEIRLMIDLHHRLNAYKDPTFPLVEVFRRAAWVDVSRGRRKYRLDPAVITDVLAAFPNHGFHKKLIQLTKARFRRRPLNPLPMIRW